MSSSSIQLSRILHQIPWNRFLIYGLAIVFFFYIVAPFWWLVLSSFMLEVETLSVPPHWIPQEPTLMNYQVFLNPEKEIPIATGVEQDHKTPAYKKFAASGALRNAPKALRNSAIVAFSVALANLVIASPAAYAFARLRFIGSRKLQTFYLATRMVPGIAVAIPIFVIIKRIGLLDTLLSLIITYTSFTLPYTIWMLRSYFQSIPRDIEDAARVDRCNWVNMMVRVFLPLATPGLVAAGIFAFMTGWGEFLFAVLFTSTMASRTMPVVVANFATDLSIEYSLMCTAGVLSVIPPLILALVFQRLIIQGLAAGALKG